MQEVDHFLRLRARMAYGVQERTNTRRGEARPGKAHRRAAHQKMLAGGVSEATEATRFRTPRLLQALRRRNGSTSGHPLAGCRRQGRSRCKGGRPCAKALRRRRKAVTAPRQPLVSAPRGRPGDRDAWGRTPHAPSR
eukprot:2329774-Alexandrium_andersonii.AAC.1